MGSKLKGEWILERIRDDERNAWPAENQGKHALNLKETGRPVCLNWARDERNCRSPRQDLAEQKNQNRP